MLSNENTVWKSECNSYRYEILHVNNPLRPRFNYYKMQQILTYNVAGFLRLLKVHS